MFSSIEKNVCCSQSTSTNSCECPHCLASFCNACMLSHQHYTIKNEFLNMTQQIDNILKGFLHHAHNQTEWTNHLTEDRNRLQDYIRYIENYPKHLQILGLPNSKWVSHVRSLISKYFFAIHESCYNLLYSSSTFSTKPLTTGFRNDKKSCPDMCGLGRQRLRSTK